MRRPSSRQATWTQRHSPAYQRRERWISCAEGHPARGTPAWIASTRAPGRWSRTPWSWRTWATQTSTGRATSCWRMSATLWATTSRTPSASRSARCSTWATRHASSRSTCPLHVPLVALDFGSLNRCPGSTQASLFISWSVHVAGVVSVYWRSSRALACPGMWLQKVWKLIPWPWQVRFGVLNAGNFGVSQSRKRTFIWGVAPDNELPQWPAPLHVFHSPQLTIKLPGGIEVGLHHEMRFRRELSSCTAIHQPITCTAFHHCKKCSCWQFRPAVGWHMYQIAVLNEWWDVLYTLALSPPPAIPGPGFHSSLTHRIKQYSTGTPLRFGATTRPWILRGYWLCGWDISFLLRSTRLWRSSLAHHCAP